MGSNPAHTRRPLRIGVVGVGRIGALHARHLLALDEVSEVIVTDLMTDLARDFADRHGAEVAADAAELMAEVDAVVIASPTPTHAPLLAEAARRGLPTFCEKPISLDLGETDRVLAAIDEAGVEVQLGFQRRFDAEYARVRALVTSGALGRVYAVKAGSHDADPPPGEYLVDSGGIYRDMHIHDFDALPWMIDQPITEVYADGAELIVDRLPEGDADVTAVVLRFEGGALATISGARHDPLGYDHRLEVFAERDSLAVGLGPRTPLRAIDGDEPVDPYPGFIERYADAYRREVEVFVEVATGRASSPCDVRAGRRALVAAIAAGISRRERRPVLVAEVAA